jgi:hypothetical protein
MYIIMIYYIHENTLLLSTVYSKLDSNTIELKFVFKLFITTQTGESNGFYFVKIKLKIILK